MAALWPQPGIRRANGGGYGNRRPQKAGGYAVVRRRLGLVQRLWRKIIFPYDGLRGSRASSCKARADNLDAFVYMVLVEEGADRREMGDYLYRDRTHLAVYAKAMFGMALYALEDAQRLKMILQNIEQYLVQDDENQTAYLNLPNSSYWWYWYGSEYEAHG